MNINKTTLFFLIFLMIIFAKILLFHYDCFGYIAISSLWSNTLEFLNFYSTKLWPAMFIASFIYIFPNMWWTIIILFCIDIWEISNIVYFKANEMFLNIDAIRMYNNMNGFWNSIYAYVDSIVLITLLISIIWIIMAWKCNNKKNKKNHTGFRVSILLSLLIYIQSGIGNPYNKRFENTNFYNDIVSRKVELITPLPTIRSLIQDIKGDRSATLIDVRYVESNSILHIIPTTAVYAIIEPIYKKHHKATVIYTESDSNTLKRLVCNNVNKEVKPKYNLLIILVESLESWVLEAKDIKGNEVTYNLNRLCENSHVMYCSKVKSQVKQGTSGDGQMIINTGMLPIQRGAACMLYGENEYPNYAHLYPYSAIINPWALVWNQHKVTKSYGYQQLIECNGQTNTHWNDNTLINKTIQYIKKVKSPFCVLSITSDSHTPFTSVSSKNLSFLDNMPQLVKNYLESIHYSDSCIGQFLNFFFADSSLSNNTILVITGDHTVFKKTALKDFQAFAQKYNYPIPLEEAYCPLIIYSPNIVNNIRNNDICYQMDIFPTILYSINAENYFWKGFGVNLLDSIARSNRSVSEKEAYNLSDKMIRSNYFKTN